MPERTEKVGTIFVAIGLPDAILKYTSNHVLGSRRKTEWEVYLPEADVDVKEMQGWREALWYGKWSRVVGPPSLTLSICHSPFRPL